MACSCQETDSVSWAEFLPYILPSIGNVPDEIVGHAARVAAIEMAGITKSLKRTLYVDAQRGVQHYNICVPDGYSFLSIDYVKDGCSLYPANRAPDPFTPMTCSRWHSFDKPDIVYVNPAPCRDELRYYEVRVNVLPGQDTCYIDRCFYDEYAEVIAHGALSRLYRMKAEDWYDPGLAREHERLWRDALRTAKVRSLKNHSADPLYMRASRFV